MKSPNDVVSELLTKQEGEDLIRRIESGKEDVGLSWLDDFRRLFAKANFVTLTVAFEPERDFLLKVKSFFEFNLGSFVIVDLKIDPALVGGATVICRNHFRDYSLATRVDEKLHGQL